ncbi:MAG: hypothetical protein K2W88_03505 [Pararheinheimera sp.]|nr:hypothetical protein [Rheinheimera sp.]
MSVINKMLRDLDKQQQKQNGRRPGSVRHRQPNYLLVWLAVPVALALGWLAQSWYMDNQVNPTNSGDKKSGKLDPAAVATEMLPELKQSLDHLTKLPGHSGPEVSLNDVAASRMSPEIAAKLSKNTQATEPQLLTGEGELQSFASQAKIEERVVSVNVDPEFSDTTLLSTDDVAEDDSALVQIDRAELEEKDFPPDEPSVESTKPRSLAIEKVELTQEQKLQLFAQSARKAESVGDLKKAVTHWQDAISLDPAKAEPYLEIARLWQMQKNDTEAQNILERAEVFAAKDARVSLALATIALKQQDWKKILAYLSYEPDIQNAIDFYALKAAALQKDNQHSLAVHTFQQLARQQPGQARWWLGMALSYDALKQPKEALLAYRQALANGSGLAQASVSYIKKRIAALE